SFISSPQSPKYLLLVSIILPFSYLEHMTLKSNSADVRSNCIYPTSSMISISGRVYTCHLRLSLSCCAAFFKSAMRCARLVCIFRFVRSREQVNSGFYGGVLFEGIGQWFLSVRGNKSIHGVYFLSSPVAK